MSHVERWTLKAIPYLLAALPAVAGAASGLPVLQVSPDLIGAPRAPAPRTPVADAPVPAPTPTPTPASTPIPAGAPASARPPVATQP
ncbi:MAG: hypothetical protein KDF24_04620, partial [Rhodocyclaceae bacterium]|nr:hypothetical protein [Rhodocyclaceae bacterium]